MFEKLDVIDAEVATLAALSDGDLATHEGSALGDAILRLDTTIRRLEAVRLQMTRVHSRSMAWKADGAKSPTQWHRDRRNLSGGQAATQVHTAHGLADLPRTAAGLAAGTVSTAQAAAAARTRGGLTDDQLGELDAMVAQTAPATNDRQLRDAVTDFVHTVSPDTPAERERQAFARRNLRLGRRRDGGWWIDGRLDVVGGETLATALSALTTPRAEGDDRTSDQRRADALADLADRALRAGDPPAEGGLRPHVAVTAELTTLEARAPARAARLDHSGPVSGEAARQIACDADVHRIITTGASEILDVGRATRIVSRAQRRALAARDGGCVGCDAPPGWTDAHHIRHWIDGGATDLDNLVLLCRGCHTSVHHRDWWITRDDDGRYRVHRPRRRRGNASAGGRNPDPDPDHAGSRGPNRDTAAARGPTTGDQTTRDQTARDQTAHGPTARDPTAGDQTARDQTTGDPITRDQTAGEPNPGRQIAHGQTTRDPNPDGQTTLGLTAGEHTTGDHASPGPTACDRRPRDE